MAERAGSDPEQKHVAGGSGGLQPSLSLCPSQRGDSDWPRWGLVPTPWLGQGGRSLVGFVSGK